MDATSQAPGADEFASQLVDEQQPGTEAPSLTQLSDEHPVAAIAAAASDSSSAAASSGVVEPATMISDPTGAMAQHSGSGTSVKLATAAAAPVFPSHSAAWDVSASAVDDAAQPGADIAASDVAEPAPVPEVTASTQPSAAEPVPAVAAVAAASRARRVQCHLSTLPTTTPSPPPIDALPAAVSASAQAVELAATLPSAAVAVSADSVAPSQPALSPSLPPAQDLGASPLAESDASRSADPAAPLAAVLPLQPAGVDVAGPIVASAVPPGDPEATAAAEASLHQQDREHASNCISAPSSTDGTVVRVDPTPVFEEEEAKQAPPVATAQPSAAASEGTAEPIAASPTADANATSQLLSPPRSAASALAVAPGQSVSPITAASSFVIPPAASPSSFVPPPSLPLVVSSASSSQQPPSSSPSNSGDVGDLSLLLTGTVATLQARVAAMQAQHAADLELIKQQRDLAAFREQQATDNASLRDRQTAALTAWWKSTLEQQLSAIAAGTLTADTLQQMHPPLLPPLSPSPASSLSSPPLPASNIIPERLPQSSPQEALAAAAASALLPAASSAASAITPAATATALSESPELIALKLRLSRAEAINADLQQSVLGVERQLQELRSPRAAALNDDDASATPGASAVSAPPVVLDPSLVSLLAARTAEVGFLRRTLAEAQHTASKDAAAAARQGELHRRRTEEAEADVERLQSSLAEQRTACAESEAARAALQVRLEEQESARVTLVSALEDARAELSSSAEAARMSADCLQIAQSNLAELEQQHKQRLEEHASTTQELRTQLADLAAAHAKEKEEWQVALQAQQQSAEEQRLSLEAQLEVLRDQVSSTDTAITAALAERERQHELQLRFLASSLERAHMDAMAQLDATLTVLHEQRHQEQLQQIQIHQAAELRAEQEDRAALSRRAALALCLSVSRTFRRFVLSHAFSRWTQVHLRGVARERYLTGLKHGVDTQGALQAANRQQQRIRRDSSGSNASSGTFSISSPSGQIVGSGQPSVASTDPQTPRLAAAVSPPLHAATATPFSAPSAPLSIAAAPELATTSTAAQQQQQQQQQRDMALKKIAQFLPQIRARSLRESVQQWHAMALQSRLARTAAVATAAMSHQTTPVRAPERGVLSASSPLPRMLSSTSALLGAQQPPRPAHRFHHHQQQQQLPSSQQDGSCSASSSATDLALAGQLSSSAPVTLSALAHGADSNGSSGEGRALSYSAPEFASSSVAPAARTSAEPATSLAPTSEHHLSPSERSFRASLEAAQKMAARFLEPGPNGTVAAPNPAKQHVRRASSLSASSSSPSPRRGGSGDVLTHSPVRHTAASAVRSPFTHHRPSASSPDVRERFLQEQRNVLQATSSPAHQQRVASIRARPSATAHASPSQRSESNDGPHSPLAAVPPAPHAPSSLVLNSSGSPSRGSSGAARAPRAGTGDAGHSYNAVGTPTHMRQASAPIVSPPRLAIVVPYGAAGVPIVPLARSGSKTSSRHSELVPVARRSESTRSTSHTNAIGGQPSSQQQPAPPTQRSRSPAKPQQAAATPSPLAMQRESAGSATRARSRKLSAGSSC